MTAQMSDNLIFESNACGVDDPFLNPFGGLQNAHEVSKAFHSRRTCTACHRGYIADWVIRNNKLFLSNLIDQISFSSSAPKPPNLIHDLYQIDMGLVKATWVTKKIIAYSGMHVDDIDWYLPVFEKYFEFDIQNGELISYKMHNADWWRKRHQ